MKKRERNKTNKILLNTYLVLVWLLPTIGLLISIVTIDIKPFKDNFWTNASRVIFFFMTMPIYLIYARLIIIEIFPRKNKNALFFFVPYVFIFAFYYHHLHDNILYFFTLDSLPLFLGINLIFFFGLINLIYQNSIGEKISTLLGKIIVTIIIMGLYFTPVVFFTLYGHKLTVHLTLTEQITVSLAKYYFAIILVALFNIKAVKNLYQSGML